MKSQKCILICNTKWGYCLKERECESIREAIRIAKELEMAYRIFVNGKCIRRGG